MRYSFLFFGVALAAPAQIVSFGVRGGVPVTNAMPGRYFSTLSYVDTGRWTIGPTIEFHLPFHLSIEVDALFRGYRSGNASTLRLGAELPSILYSFQQDVKAWDFPLLLKYRFPGRAIRPFVNAGASWTHESVDAVWSHTCLGPGSCYPQEGIGPFTGGQFVTSRTREGFVGGAGVEFKVQHFKLAPELRYTRLADPRTNQFAVLFGVTF